MKVSEFRELSRYIKETEEIIFHGTPIQIKGYLTEEEKQQLIDMVTIAFLNDYNPLTKEIFKVYGIIKNYTDISLPQKTVEFIDEDGEEVKEKRDDIGLIFNIASASGLYDEIIEIIPKNEINFLFDLIDKTIEEKVKQENKLINVVKNFLQEINESIPEGINALNNFDEEKLKKIQEIMGLNK